MNKLYLAYIAGIFDGEGCITITKTYRKDLRTDHWASVQLTWVDIPKQREVSEQLKKNFEGYLAFFKPKNTPSRPIVFWRLQSKKAARFIKLLLPYLKVKKRHAEIIIRYSELQGDNRKRGARWETPEALKEKGELLKEIQTLNKRGISNTVND